MKKIIILFFIAVSSYNSRAQLFPQHSQFFLNNYLLNPAVTGIENYVDIKMNIRSQWNGIEGRPETQYVSFHMPLYGNIPNEFRVNPIKPSDMREGSIERMETVSSKNIKPHHGLGGVVLMDKAGNYRRYQTMASYAYHMPFTRKINIALGVAAGINMSQIDMANVKLADMTDPILGSEKHRDLRPVIQVGGWLYHRKYFLGVSYLQDLGEPITFNEYIVSNTNIGASSQLFLTGGCRLQLNSETMIIPIFLLKQTSHDLPYQLDLAMKASFYNRFWAGVALREMQSANIFVGIAVSPLLEISYAYDLGIGGVDQFSAGSHEIMLGIRLNNTNKVYCPNFH